MGSSLWLSHHIAHLVLPWVLPHLLYLPVLYIIDVYQALPPGTGEGWYWLNKFYPVAAVQKLSMAPFAY